MKGSKAVARPAGAVRQSSEFAPRLRVDRFLLSYLYNALARSHRHSFFFLLSLFLFGLARIVSFYFREDSFILAFFVVLFCVSGGIYLSDLVGLMAAVFTFKLLFDGPFPRPRRILLLTLRFKIPAIQTYFNRLLLRVTNPICAIRGEKPKGTERSPGESLANLCLFSVCLRTQPFPHLFIVPFQLPKGSLKVPRIQPCSRAAR